MFGFTLPIITTGVMNKLFSSNIFREFKNTSSILNNMQAMYVKGNKHHRSTHIAKYFFGVNGITWLGFMILEHCMCFACLEKGLMVIEIKFLC
jgi:hypothetical protein